MQKKLCWAAVLLVLVFLFRDRLLGMLPFQQEGFSLPAVITALIGGAFAFFMAYTFVTAGKFHSVWQVTSLIVFSGFLTNMLGHWLAGFPVFGEFWGGFIGGALETAVLWGAIYGAKEVWTGGRE